MVRSPNLTRLQAAVIFGFGAAAGLFLCAVLVNDGTGGPHGQLSAPALVDPPSTAANSTVEPRDDGPDLASSDRPDRADRTPEGAVATAVAHIVRGQDLIDSDPAAAEAIVRETAAQDTADVQVEATLTALAELREALADGIGPIVYRQAVVSYRVEAFTPDRARVAVWSVGVLAREGVAPPQAGWSIQVSELVWERGAWRVWATTTQPGPAPILNDSVAPATIAEFLTALDGFEDLGSPW